MIQRVILIFCAFTFIQCSYSQNQANDFAIIEEGRSNVDIVIDGDADEQIRDAAEVLQLYIKRSTGVKIDIVTEQPSNQYILIGEASSTLKDSLGLLNDGFLISTTDTHIKIIGGGSWGAEYGVYSFLEKYIGVRWLMPTDDWTVIPKLNRVDVPKGEILENPKFLSRRLAPLNEEGNSDQDVWGRLNRLRNDIEFNHNLFRVFPVSKFGSKNSNIYPSLNGKRYIPLDKNDQKWQPNFSNQETIEIAVDHISNFFDKNPHDKSFSLGINDSKRFDDGSKTQLINYLGEEDRSDEYYQWVNNVVGKLNKKYPDKFYGLLAYNNTFDPPSFRLKNNVVPFITYERFKWVDSQLEKEGKEITRKWAVVSANIGWYDYNYGFNYYLPKVWFHHMKDYLLWGYENGVNYYVAEFYPNWGEGPKGWLTAKLLWNPTQNVDSLLEDWYTTAFGEVAGAKVAEYYSIWEGFWSKDVKSTKWWSDRGQYLPFNNFEYLGEVPDSYITDSDNVLNEALELVNNEEERTRLEDIIKMWKFYKSAILLYKNNKNLILQDSNVGSKLADKSDVGQVDVLSIYETFKNLLNEFGSEKLFSYTAGYYNRSGASHSSMRSLGLKSVLNNDKSFENTSQSLILNSSFEKGKVPWGTWISQTTNGNFNVSSNHANEGDFSVQAEDIILGTLYQDFEFEKGNYLVSLNYLVPESNGQENVSIELRIYDKNKKRIKNISSSVATEIPIEYGIWKKATLAINIDPEFINKADFIRLIINIENMDEIYLDDIVTTKINY